MNVTLNKFSRFAIVALMLFMQSATIAHSIEHADGEHTEHCSAFTTAEQLADTPKDNGLLAASCANYFTLQPSPSLSFITKRLGKLSRAPPSPASI